MIWKVLGAAAGLLGASFYRLISWCQQTFDADDWIVWLLPAGGILIAWMYSRAGSAGDTNNVLRAVQGGHSVSPGMTDVPHLRQHRHHPPFGGSVGTEGAAVQIGAGVAYAPGRLGKLRPEQVRVLLTSGISGCFAVIVGTPVTAVILAIELAGVLAALCGLVSIGKCTSIQYAAKGYSRLSRSPLWRVALGGLIVAALTWAAGATAYNGDGLPLRREAAAGRTEPASFLWKMASIALTLGAGFEGGAIVPTLVTGATFGGWRGPLLGLSAQLSAGLGMTAVFCGAINGPVTSFALGMELVRTPVCICCWLALSAMCAPVLASCIRLSSPGSRRSDGRWAVFRTGS